MPTKYLENVDEHLKLKHHPLENEVNELRKIIKDSSNKIIERVKWNAPSYYLVKDGKEFDFGSFNLFQKSFMQFIIVFYNGLPETDFGILKGDWKDRREMRFNNIEEINNHKDNIQKLVKFWVESTLNK